jgi:hypothetical protein
VSALGGPGADADADDRPTVQHGAGEERLPAGVHRCQERFGGGVGGGRVVVRHPDAGEVELRRSGELEAGVGLDPRDQIVREREVLTDHRLPGRQAFGADGEPQLQGAEPTSERDLPVAVVDGGTGFSGGGAQVLGQDRQRCEQRGAVRHPERVAVEVHAHPLVRVGRVAVCVLQAVVHPSQLRAQRGDAGHRRIDVEPDAVALRDLRDGAHRIHRHRRGGPHTGDDDGGEATRGEILGDHGVERIGPHGVGRVGGHQSQMVAADAGDAHRLLDGGVGLGRRVDDRLRSAGEARTVARPTEHPFTCREDGAQHGLAGRALDDAATLRAGGAEPVGQAEQIDHPIEHEGLDLGGCRAGGPRHPVHPEPGRRQLSEDGRVRRVRREVREEARVLPVGDARQDHTIQVCEHRLEPFGLCWEGAPAASPGCPGLHGR